MFMLHRISLKSLSAISSATTSGSSRPSRIESSYGNPHTNWRLESSNIALYVSSHFVYDQWSLKNGDVSHSVRFFSLLYSRSFSSSVNSAYRGSRRNVRNFFKTVSMVSLEIRRYSSSNRTLHRLPLLLSDAVTTLMILVFLNAI